MSCFHMQCIVTNSIFSCRLHCPPLQIFILFLGFKLLGLESRALSHPFALSVLFYSVYFSHIFVPVPFFNLFLPYLTKHPPVSFPPWNCSLVQSAVGGWPMMSVPELLCHLLGQYVGLGAILVLRQERLNAVSHHAGEVQEDARWQRAVVHGHPSKWAE